MREQLQHEHAIQYAGVSNDLKEQEALLRNRLSSLNQQAFQLQGQKTALDSLFELEIIAEKTTINSSIN